MPKRFRWLGHRAAIALSIVLNWHASVVLFAQSRTTADTIRLREEWIADADLDSSYPAFGVLAGIAVDARGNSYIADASNNTIRVLNRAGKYITSIGRKGDGPGEFVHPTGLGINAEGNLVVRDSRRYAIFGIDSRTNVLGKHLRQFNRVAFTDWVTMYPLVFGPSQTIFDAQFNYIDRAGKVYGHYNHLNAGGEVIDTIPVRIVPDAPRLMTPMLRISKGSAQGFMGLAEVPFAPHPTWAITPRGTALITGGNRYEIEERTSNWQLVRTISRSTTPTAIPRTERAESLAALTTRLDSVRAILSSIINVSDAVKRKELPTTFPAVRSVHSAEDGSTWVRRWIAGASKQSVFDIFDEMGRYQSTLVLPRIVAVEPQPTLRRDRIVAVYIDPETGAHSVVSFVR